MIGHSYAMDVQNKASNLADSILAAASPEQIAAACAGVEAFLQKHTPDQNAWFFSITFPTLICRVFGFDEAAAAASATKPLSPNGWIDVATLSRNSELCGTIFNLLWPNGVLFSAISAVDRSSLVKYIFPNERLPEWIRFLLQNQKDPQVLAELCPIFKDRIKDTLDGSPFQVQLSVLEYYMFWFAYYPVYRGNGEGPQPVKVQRSRKFRLENWGYSIPGLSSNKRNAEQKEEGNLYLRLLYAYLRASVPLYNLNAYQPYRSSLLHHSREYDSTFTESAEFLVHVFINFWLIDNCFSPLPLSLCKAYGVSFPFRSLLGETPPTPGLGEVINVFVKYLTLTSIMSANGYQKLDWNGSPLLKTLGSIDAIKPINAGLDLQPTGSWNSWIQRALYRYILRSFLFCPVQTSMKNVSQVFTLWVSYMEPWKISLEEFADIDSMMGMSSRSTLKEVSGTSESCYSPLWQWFVLSNYLYYSSLVMHFIGFAHKFLHTDPEAIVLMVSKVISILTSTAELVDLIRNFDNLFHSKPSGSSKSLLSELYKYVPVIRNELQDWEYGLCESDADGSFLHDNWNKDLKLFSEGEDGGQQLFQLFVLRAEAELHANSSGLQCLDDLKSGLVKLYGGAILMSPTPSGTPEAKETQHAPQPAHIRDDAFRPRNFGNQKVTNVKYKGDWMMRPIGDDEIGWLAVLLVKLSSWLNEILGLNQANTGNEGPVWSYVDLSGEGPVIGVADTMNMVLCSFLSIIVTAAGAVVKLMKNHGLRVNLRVLASKKVAAMLALFVAFSMLKRAIS